MGTESPMATVVLTDTTALEALRPEWAELLADSEADELMQSPDWLLPGGPVFGPLQGGRLRTVVFRAEGRLVGLAPLARRWHTYRPCLPFRRIEALGSGEREADAICSDYLGVIARRGWGPAVADSLAATVASGRLGGWDEFVVSRMDGERAMPELLAGA